MAVPARYLVNDVQTVSSSTEAGVPFRGPLVTGPGGTQAVLDDPAGTPVESFQPAPEQR